MSQTISVIKPSSQSVLDSLKFSQTALTFDEIISQAGLDFDVEKQDLTTTKGTKVPNHIAVVRPDTDAVLGVVGRNFGLVPYKKTFSFVEEMLKDAKVVVHGGTVYGRGEQAVLTLRINDDLQLGPQDKIENYCFLSSAHDGTGNIVAGLCPHRPANNSVLSTGYALKLRHSRRVVDALVRANTILATLRSDWQKMETTLKKLAALKINEGQAANYFEDCFPGDGTRISKEGKEIPTVVGRLRTNLMDMYKKQGLPSCNGTLFGAWQTICEHSDHVRAVNKRKYLSPGAAKIYSVVDPRGASAKRKFRSLGFAIAIERKLGEQTLSGVLTN